jgi:osmotically-inducible protein OsmY
VRLSGEVASADERDAARVIVENILGVKCVKNHLSISEAAQERHALRSVA